MPKFKTPLLPEIAATFQRQNTIRKILRLASGLEVHDKTWICAEIMKPEAPKTPTPVTQ